MFGTFIRDQNGKPIETGTARIPFMFEISRSNFGEADSIS